MRKTILTTSLFVILTLSLTQLATSQWKDNVFTNQTSGNLFVAFTTYRPASDGIPLGWRTTAWYLIEAGETHTFQAFADNPIYYLILNSTASGSLLPENAKTYRGWMYRSAFKIVSEDEPDTLTPAADLLFKEPRNPAHSITENSNYFKSANTGAVTVTSTGVTAPLAEIEDGTGPGNQAGSVPHSVTINSFSTSIYGGDSRTITVTVKSSAGNPIVGQIVRFQENSSAISLSLASGTTNSSGQVSTTLTTSNVSSQSSATFYVRIDGYPELDKSTSVTINPVPHSLSISLLPSVIYSGDSEMLTATVKSTSGSVMSGVEVRFSESSSYLRWNPTSVNTNSSGQASSTLKTGGHDDDTKHYVTVSVPGTSLEAKDWTRVQGRVRNFPTKTGSYGSRRDCLNSNRRGEYSWSKTITLVSAPDRVLNATVASEIPPEDECCITFSDFDFTENNTAVRMYGRVFPHCVNQNTISFTVTGTYLDIAPYPRILVSGAPSLHRQLRSDPDQLSMFWEDMSQIPSETALLTNYPNPFNPETWIPYHLAEPADVTLSIYSADGRLVRTLALGHQDAGIYESKSRAAYWDGRNAIGERVASGVYFYTFAASEFTATGKMLIMK